MFSYFTPYRVESKDVPSFPLLVGASEVEDNRWVFFSSDEDSPSLHTFDFEALHRTRDGVISGITRQGDKARFIPITIVDVQAKPERYDLTPEAAQAMRRPSDLYLFLVAAGVPQWYEDSFAPPEELTDEGEEEVDEGLLAPESRSLVEAAFFEAKGVPAEVGDVHNWNDGFEYMKHPDGAWRRIGSEWADEHPSVPKNTKDQFYDKDWGWDPHRRAMHEKLLATIRAEVFAGKAPVGPDETPSFTYIMGPPAAGKSTRSRSSEYDNTVKLDPDEFVERLPEFQHAKNVKARNGASSVVEEALMLNDVMVKEAQEGRYNFIVAGTGSSLDWIENEFFPALKKNGYRINVVMTHVEDVDELLKRTEARGHRSGRFVPPARTQELHKRLPRNFKRLMKNPDINYLALLNSHQSPEAEVKNTEVYQKLGDKEKVVDQRFFDDFIA